MLREALGSEIMAHFTVDAPPALTEDVKELAQDIGDERVVQELREEASKRRRSSAASARVPGFSEGEVTSIAVDTSALHFFDPDTGLGVYDKPGKREVTA